MLEVGVQMKGIYPLSAEGAGVGSFGHEPVAQAHQHFVHTGTHGGIQPACLVGRFLGLPAGGSGSVETYFFGSDGLRQILRLLVQPGGFVLSLFQCRCLFLEAAQFCLSVVERRCGLRQFLRMQGFAFFHPAVYLRLLSIYDLSSPEQLLPCRFYLCGKCRFPGQCLLLLAELVGQDENAVIVPLQLVAEGFGLGEKSHSAGLAFQPLVLSAEVFLLCLRCHCLCGQTGRKGTEGLFQSGFFLPGSDQPVVGGFPVCQPLPLGDGSFPVGQELLVSLVFRTGQQVGELFLFPFGCLPGHRAARQQFNESECLFMGLAGFFHLFPFFRQLPGGLFQCRHLFGQQRMPFLGIVGCLCFLSSLSGLGEKPFDGHTVGSEMFRVGQLFQYRFPFHLVTCQESGELPLCQHRHPPELFEGQSDGTEDGLSGLCLYPRPIVGSHFHFPTGSGMLHGPQSGRLVPKSLRHTQRESGTVFLPIVANEDDFAIAVVFLRNAQAGILLDAVDANAFAFLALEIVVDFVGYSHQAGCFLVEGHGDAVEDNGFSGSRVAGNQENGCGRTCEVIVQSVLEINIRPFDRGDIP